MARADARLEECDSTQAHGFLKAHNDLFFFFLLTSKIKSRFDLKEESFFKLTFELDGALTDINGKYTK